jgi:hypothetical protein
MKRVLLVLTAIALVFAVAGCGSAGAGGGAGDNAYTGKDKSGNEYTVAFSTPKAAASGDDYSITIVQKSGNKLRGNGKVTDVTGGNITCGTAPGAFVIQTGANNAINKITGIILLNGGATFPLGSDGWDQEASDPFDDAVGLKKDITVLSGATWDSAKGIIEFPVDEYSGGFTIAIPPKTAGDPTTNVTDENGTKKIVIEYVCKIASGTPRLILKQVNATNPSNGNGSPLGLDIKTGQYKDLTAGTVAKLEIPETSFNNGTSIVAAQKGGTDGTIYQLKIISIKWE